MDNVLVISEDGSTIICCDKSYSGVITVPDGINSIGDNAFENCSLSKIVLPSSLKRIGRRAFANCANLVDAVLCEGIVKICPSAFSGCISLSYIYLPISLSNIGKDNYSEGSVFEGCISLESIEIPKGINEIPRRTFAECVNLSSIRIPKTIRTIGYDAFDNCVSLQMVIISDVVRWCYVKKLSNPLSYAHHLYVNDDTEIINLEFPEKIGSISAHTFENCTGIKSACFPDGFVDVGHDAFKGCLGLREITLNSENVGEILNEFDGCNNVEIINIKHFTPNFCIGLKGFGKLKAVYSVNDDETRTIIDIDNVTTSKAQELKLMSMYYHNLDMNLTMIQGRYPNNASFKAPINKEGMLLENLYHSKQDTSVLLKQDWLNASGMGLVLGWNDFRALDFDNFISPINYILEEGDRKIDIEDYNIGDYRRECLLLLGLPEDYQWVVWSGSKRGFHIIIRVKDSEERESSPTSYGYYPYFSTNKRIELRWKGHLILPPSIHCSGESYRFFNNQIPTTEPVCVNLGKIEDLLDYYCGENHYNTYDWEQRSFEIVERIKNNAEDSQGVHYDSKEEKRNRNYIQWLETCGTSQAYNTLAIKYLLGKDVPANKSKAFEYFKKASLLTSTSIVNQSAFGEEPNYQRVNIDNSLAFFNIASLMSIGYFEGTQQEINSYIDKIKIEDLFLPGFYNEQFPEDYIKPKIDRIRKQSAKYLHNTTYLFFDTETTGVPVDYKAPSSDTENWPRMVQLAWILEDENGIKIDSGNLIIIPDGFIIPDEAVKVHGITKEKALKEGVPLEYAIRQFKANLDVATCVVGHNADFDKKIVGAEMIRLGLKDIMDSKKSHCTMQSSIDFCKIPGKYGYKYPKLQELYKKLFGIEFDNAHNAMSDIEATEKCFWELRKRKLI